jgi:hypothetical protein
MNKWIASSALIAGIVTSGHAEATTPINVTMRIQINRVEGGPPQLNGPFAFSYNATFNGEPAGAYDQGTRTNTSFVTGSSSAITSGVFSLLPALAQSATPYQSISGRSDDYQDVFINSIAFSDQRYYNANGFLGQTVSELFFETRMASRGGTGAADRPIGLNEIDEILQVGKVASFFIFDRIYDPANTRTTWSGTATIVSVKTAVPEPTYWALLLTGFAIIGYLQRRRLVVVAVA